MVVGGTAAELGGGKFANGAITGAFVMLFNDMAHGIQEKSAQKKVSNLEDGIRNVLSKAKSGTVITSKDLVEIYGVPSDAASLIKSFTVMGNSTISVKWNGNRTWMIESVTNARFKDGIIRVAPSKDSTYNFFDGKKQSFNNPLHITGGAIGVKDNGSIDYDFTYLGYGNLQIKALILYIK